jgi:two-component system sensor histidine kinase KdpD
MVITLPLSTGAPFDSPADRAPLEPQPALTGRSHRPPVARIEPNTGQATGHASGPEAL